MRATRAGYGLQVVTFKFWPPGCGLQVVTSRLWLPNHGRQISGIVLASRFWDDVYDIQLLVPLGHYW